MARAGKMKEAAEVVLFLCSKEASYITGVVLPVDGGVTAWLIAHGFYFVLTI